MSAPVTSHRSQSGGTVALGVVACGAIGRELVAALRLQGLVQVDVIGLPAILHNHPDRIAASVRSAVRQLRDRHGDLPILVGYADCGTAGALDTVCREERVERLPGPHCYAALAGREEFARLQDEEPETFYLTDYLVRHFDRLVWATLGLDRHPHLREMYFANYRRVVYLAQTEDPQLDALAQRAAERLGLSYHRQLTGIATLSVQLGRTELGANRATITSGDVARNVA